MEDHNLLPVKKKQDTSAVFLQLLSQSGSLMQMCDLALPAAHFPKEVETMGLHTAHTKLVNSFRKKINLRLSAGRLQVDNHLLDMKASRAFE